jgi:hypothetical protein
VCLHHIIIYFVYCFVLHIAVTCNVLYMYCAYLCRQILIPVLLACVTVLYIRMFFMNKKLKLILDKLVVST